MSRRPPLKDEGLYWRLAIGGALVNECCFDFGVVLRLAGPSATWEFRLEQPFVITLPDRSEHLVIPEEGAGFDVVLQLLRKPTDVAFAFKDGPLEMRMRDGTLVLVPANEGFEAWSVAGPKNTRLASLPGGDIAVWPPEGGSR
jgi:hypothetical protein